MDSDKLTTVFGGIVAGGYAAQVAVGQMTPGATLHAQDYITLFVSVATAVWAFFTNRKAKAQ